MRQRLQKLCDRIVAQVGPLGYRAFVDSAPVLEKALARNAGLGWIGKHTNLIDRGAGSYFFIGEIYLSLALPLDAPSTAHCGTCSACLPACPTGAIVAPYRLDARRCISYLTIELAGTIPLELRRAIGNRIYGCDDCQLVCPWNKFARPTAEKDFAVRHGLDRATLIEVFAWSEAEFLEKTRGSAHPPHRLRALVAQRRGRARQRTDLARGHCSPPLTRRGALGLGARARRLGARPARRRIAPPPGCAAKRAPPSTLRLARGQ